MEFMFECMRKFAFCRSMSVIVIWRFVLHTSRDHENQGRNSCLPPKNLKYMFFPERDLESHCWSPATEKESALFGHSPFSSVASEQTVMVSNKLSGPVYS